MYLVTVNRHIHFFIIGREHYFPILVLTSVPTNVSRAREIISTTLPEARGGIRPGRVAIFARRRDFHNIARERVIRPFGRDKQVFFVFI